MEVKGYEDCRDVVIARIQELLEETYDYDDVCEYREHENIEEIEEYIVAMKELFNQEMDNYKKKLIEHAKKNSLNDEQSMHDYCMEWERTDAILNRYN